MHFPVAGIPNIEMQKSDVNTESQLGNLFSISVSTEYLLGSWWKFRSRHCRANITSVPCAMEQRECAIVLRLTSPGAFGRHWTLCRGRSLFRWSPWYLNMFKRYSRVSKSSVGVWKDRERSCGVIEWRSSKKDFSCPVYVTLSHVELDRFPSSSCRIMFSAFSKNLGPGRCIF